MLEVGAIEVDLDGHSSGPHALWIDRVYRYDVRFLLVVLVACGADKAAQSPAVSEWTDFYGIQYQAPPGTAARVTDSVLPGPGGEGGSPVGERPYVALSMPGRFHVTITKTRAASTLAATKALYVANRLGTDHAGTSTATGWEMTYRVPRSDDSTKTSVAHLVYAALGGAHYECSYDEQNCPDREAAASICRSIREKPP